MLDLVIMQSSKSDHKAPPKRMKPVMEVSALGGTLEGVVLAMLGRAGARTELAPLADTSLKERKRRPPDSLKKIAGKGGDPSLRVGHIWPHPKILTALRDHSNNLYLGLAQHGLIESKTIRFRRKADGIDRKFLVETSLDPLDGTSVLIRVRPISDAKIPAVHVAGRMLTTQQAAAELNVSRPYVIELVEKGSFKGVELTRGGHRRIPAIEVQRVRAEMQIGMRKGIDAIAELTKDASKREIEDATRNSTRRWAPRT